MPALWVFDQDHNLGWPTVGASHAPPERSAPELLLSGRIPEVRGRMSSSSCRCPEVQVVDGDGIPFCDYRMGLLDGELPPGAASSEPVGWRCHECGKGIVRSGVRLARDEDGLEDLLDLDEIRPRAADAPWLRVDWRCSKACGWAEYVLTREAEGLVAARDLEARA